MRRCASRSLAGNAQAAAAAMLLVEGGTLELDAPVAEFLPEPANRTLLRSIDSALDDTAPAQRPITLRDQLS